MIRVYLFLFILLVGFACHSDMTSPITSDVQLSAEEVAVTEAWLKVHITPSVPHDSIRITSGGNTQSLGFSSQ